MVLGCQKHGRKRVSRKHEQPVILSNQNLIFHISPNYSTLTLLALKGCSSSRKSKDGDIWKSVYVCTFLSKFRVIHFKISLIFFDSHNFGIQTRAGLENLVRWIWPVGLRLTQVTDILYFAQPMVWSEFKMT